MRLLTKKREEKMRLEEQWLVFFVLLDKEPKDEKGNLSKNRILQLFKESEDYQKLNRDFVNGYIYGMTN